MQSPSGCLIKYIICNFIAVVKPFVDISIHFKGTAKMVNNIYGHLYPNRHEEVADRLEQLVSANKMEAENPPF